MGIMIKHMLFFNIFNLLIYIMTNTLFIFKIIDLLTFPHWQQKNPIKHIMMMSILIFACLFLIIDSKETVIIEKLNTTNDKILWNLIQQTNQYIEYERFINKRPYVCKNLLKNQLTKNSIPKIQESGFNLDFDQSIELDKLPLSYSAQGNTGQQAALAKRIDKILNLLKGKCLYYYTYTFVYEYCHKEHVRQFDSLATHDRNVKVEFQDISMGLYNPEYYRARNIKKGLKQLTPQQKKVTIPSKWDFSVDYNHLLIQMALSSASIEIQTSIDGKLLHSNVHILATSQFIRKSPQIVELRCRNKKEEIKRSLALSVTPYDFVFISKVEKCQQYQFVKPANIFGCNYYQDQSQSIIRVYQNYLYGDVQQLCTSNWAWERQDGDNDLQNTLSDGSSLLLTLYNYMKSSYERHYVTVKRVITPQLIQLDIPLGYSFNISKVLNSKMKSARYIKNITKCQILFNKHVNLSEPLQINVKFINSGLLKIQSQDAQAKLMPGDNLGCLCKIQNIITSQIVDMDILINNHLWGDYYKAYIKTNTQVIFAGVGGSIFQKCQQITCYAFSELSVLNNQKQQSFTELKRLTKTDPKLEISKPNIQKIYVISIKNNGVLKMITKTSDGTIFTYLLTEAQIIKIKEFPNGTKEITKENKYYENSTMPVDEYHQNYIYVKVSRLANNQLFGGIWKYNDYAIFPRFQLKDQTILSFERTSGTSYFRILNPDQMSDKQSLALIKYMKLIEQHYKQVNINLEEEKSSQPQYSTNFLEKSYSINYTYTQGKYCDPPVNKLRKTKVTLKCGQSWFEITKLFEKVPCEYWIQIETKLLCSQNYKNVLENDEELLRKGPLDSVINHGVFCYPDYGVFNSKNAYFLYVSLE